MTTAKPSDRLIRATRDRHEKLVAYRAAVAEQTAAIVEDIAAGVPQKDICDVTELSRQRIHQMVKVPK